MHKKVVIFSGAGLSASSGISTFRDRDGLWENHNIEEICTAGCLDWNYEATRNFYNQRRLDLLDKQPNAAHKIIARLQLQYPDLIEVMTQNVDDLLEKAHCPKVMHLHGFLPEVICMQCQHIENIQYELQCKEHTTCPKCSSRMRPNIIFFGEPAPKYESMYQILNKDCGLLVVIGTSGKVIDVSYLSQYADFTILNNLEPSDAIMEECFTKIYYEDASIACEKIEEDIESFIENGYL